MTGVRQTTVYVLSHSLGAAFHAIGVIVIPVTLRAHEVPGGGKIGHREGGDCSHQFAL